MESFSDQFEVKSIPGIGTTIVFEKEFAAMNNHKKVNNPLVIGITK